MQKIYSCFVDMRKVFDSLWHNGLLYKLISNGVGKKFYQVIGEMYNISKSAVQLNNEHTNCFTLKRGVKQSDSLSPTLFSYFINDLHEIFDYSCDPKNQK